MYLFLFHPTAGHLRCTSIWAGLPPRFNASASSSEDTPPNQDGTGPQPKTAKPGTEKPKQPRKLAAKAKTNKKKGKPDDDEDEDEDGDGGDEPNTNLGRRNDDDSDNEGEPGEGSGDVKPKKRPAVRGQPRKPKGQAPTL